MIKKLSVIGATGKLALPIIKRLQENSVEVTASVRNVEKAKTLLPDGTKIKKADLNDKIALAKSLKDTEYLYLNLSIQEPDAEFVAEIDGVKNLLEVLKDSPIKQILKISGIGALHPEFNQKGEIYDANAVRSIGHQLIKDSGIPYTIFHPTWFLNALPAFIKGDEFAVYGKDAHPFYWANTTDFADQLTKAIGNVNTFNKEFAVQGKEALTFAKAGERFIKAYHPTLKLNHHPITKDMGRFGLLLSYYENVKEELVSENTWKILGEPKVKLEDFIYQTLK
ncbi:SDR family oxidoreductase [Sunxiuqinia sp. A32]|uniref:SDR family oxidoreductase n=1 Tax=Sunxiuqinia sp. A32 TaxID=3461496 RepID=UPI004045D015